MLNSPAKVAQKVLTLVIAEVTSAGSDSVISVSAVQLLLSVIKTVYVPAQRAVAVSLLIPKSILLTSNH